MRKLTKRFIIASLEDLNLSNPIRYERYYINDQLRVQKKGEKYQKEILDDENNIVEKNKLASSLIELNKEIELLEIAIYF